MTQDEIIEMYLQVSKELCNDAEWCWAGIGEPLQMFAKLVAAKAVAKEREACAKVCDGYIGADPIAAIKEALAQQEPVAWELGVVNGVVTRRPVAQPQRTWVRLTDEDWKEIENMPDTFDQGVAWAQRRLKEKNT